MAPKKIIGLVKLQIPAGKATPAPPVGPALGQHGINIMEFCSQFNNLSIKEQGLKLGLIVPVEITVYADRTFSFIIKTPPAAILIKEKCGFEKGAGNSKKEQVAIISEEDIEEIAKLKLPDLNTTDIEAAKRMIKGTARSMGVAVKNKE